MTVAGDYIGRVRLGVTIGVAGSQSFVWPDGRPAGTYTGDAGADGTVGLTVTEVGGDGLTVSWAADASRRMIGHPWRLLRDGAWLFGDLYVVEAEPADLDPVEFTVLDGTVEVRVAMVAPAGPVDAGDVSVDVAGTPTPLDDVLTGIGAKLTRRVAAFADDFDPTGSFTTVPLLPGGDTPRAYLTGATVLVVEGDHLGLWTIPASGPATAGAALAPGDVIAAANGLAGVAAATDGVTVDQVVVHATLPVSSDDVDVPQPLGALDPATFNAAVYESAYQAYPDAVVAQLVADDIESKVDLTALADPARATAVLLNIAELIAHLAGGAGVLGIGVEALSDRLAQAIYVNPLPPTDPAEPDDPERATWIRTVGGLRSFIDFRLFPDGPIDGIATNGVGGSDPATVRSFASLGYPFQPALVDAGAVISDQTTESSESDPTPKTGFTIYTNGTPLSPGANGRIEWGHGGIVEGNGDLEDYIPTNVAISDVNGDAYLMGVVLGRFDTGQNTTDPGNPVSARMRLIRDDLTAPTTVASAALPRLPQKGDRFAFTWDADGNLAGHMNGVEIVSVVETTHDIATFDRIGMPLHQGSDAVDWNDGYYTRVEWFGISDGDEITGDLGAHVWTDDGWQPAGPQARPVLGGAQGTPGADGADGASAYEVAVANGFVGNEAAWLASLVGATGATGATGPAGDPTTVADGAIPQAKVNGLEAAIARIPTVVWAASTTAARTTTGERADDPALKFTGAANTRYRVEFYVQLSGDATYDAVVGVNAPSGATCSLLVEGFGGAVSAATGANQQGAHITTPTSAGTVGVGVLASPGLAYRISGWVQLDATAGDVALYWGPNSNGGTGVIRHANSHLIHTP